MSTNTQIKYKSMDVDEDLITLAKENNQIAFTKLYNKYNRVIYNTIYNIVKNKDVADDILSVTFTKAFAKLDTYVNPISFEMWLKTIGINASIDYIRKVKKEQTNQYVDDENVFIQLESETSDPEKKMIDEEELANFSKFISRLKYKYRQILQLRYFNNLSYKEIAENLQIPEGTVKSYLNQAKKRFIILN